MNTNNQSNKNDDAEGNLTLPENKVMSDLLSTTNTSTSTKAGKTNTSTTSSHLVDTNCNAHPKQEAITKRSSIQSWSVFLESLKKIFAHEFFSQRNCTHAATATTSTTHTAAAAICSRVPPRVLLQGCTTSQEHFSQIQDMLSKCKNQSGLKGLESIGFTYRPYNQQTSCHDNDDCVTTSSTCDSNIIENDSKTNQHIMAESSQGGEIRLLHISTNTWITKQNREMYIADGEMYEEVVRLCQEYAQDLMIQEASLHWVSVCEDKTKGNPIRMLVNRNYPIPSSRSSGEKGRERTVDSSQDANHGVVGCDKEMLLITTGKGKVRAGIFSRQHLLVSSIEASTALPMVRDAKRRNMYIAILDPNARGDRYGMATYQQSMEVLFGRCPSESVPMDANARLDTKGKPSAGSLYILAHSASGSQLARYLLLLSQEGAAGYFFSRIKSIAFTDSNHSIQWLKKHSHLSALFQSSATLYIRSSNQYRDDDWERHKCGDMVDTSRDEHWLHRFGKVPTIWAGTTDHSLTNYTSHSIIWEHFDNCKCCDGYDDDDNGVEGRGDYLE